MKHTPIRENKNAENSTTSGQYANSYVASRTFVRIDPILGDQQIIDQGLQRLMSKSLRAKQ